MAKKCFVIKCDEMALTYSVYCKGHYYSGGKKYEKDSK